MNKVAQCLGKEPLTREWARKLADRLNKRKNVQSPLAPTDANTVVIGTLETRGNSMTYSTVTTLRRIRATNPRGPGWPKLLEHLGKVRADDEPLSFETVLDVFGINGTLLLMSYDIPNAKFAQDFKLWVLTQLPAESGVSEQHTVFNAASIMQQIMGSNAIVAQKEQLHAMLAQGVSA
jgi:hypothetical protein